MPLRFTSPTPPNNLIETLKALKISYQKIGVQPVQITIDNGHVHSSYATKEPLSSEQTEGLLNSLEPDTVVEILENASTQIALTVMEQLPSTAILDIGSGLQKRRAPHLKKCQSHCELLVNLPPQSRVLLRKDLSGIVKDHVSIGAITGRFHERSISVIIDNDFKRANIGLIDLSPDCAVILNDFRPKPDDATYAALGENITIRLFDVTQLSVAHCERLRAIIEQRIIQSENDVVHVKCKTKEQWNQFEDLPGVTLTMTGVIKYNPPRNIGNDAHLLLNLFRSRTPSPDSVSELAIEDEASKPAKPKQQMPIIDLTEDDEMDERYEPAQHKRQQHKRQKLTIDLTGNEIDVPSEHVEQKRQRLTIDLTGDDRIIDALKLEQSPLNRDHRTITPGRLPIDRNMPDPFDEDDYDEPFDDDIGLIPRRSS